MDDEEVSLWEVASSPYSLMEAAELWPQRARSHPAFSTRHLDRISHLQATFVPEVELPEAPRDLKWRCSKAKPLWLGCLPTCGGCGTRWPMTQRAADHGRGASDRDRPLHAQRGGCWRSEAGTILDALQRLDTGQATGGNGKGQKGKGKGKQMGKATRKEGKDRRHLLR